MNWKSEAVERLCKYSAMKTALKSIPDEIKRLEIEACRLKAARPDKISVTTSVNSGDDALLDNMVRREELQYALDSAQLWVGTTDRAMSVLNSEEKTILTRMYVTPERGVVNQLCLALGVEQSSIYRKRDQALLHFTIALYGFTNTEFRSGK